MVAQMLDLTPVHGKPASVKEMYAQFNEGEEEEQVQGRGGMCTDLRGDLTEAEGPCQRDHQDRSDPYRRVDANDDPHRQAPRQTPGCHSAAQLTQQRTQYPTAEELAYGLGHKHTKIVRPSAEVWL